MGCLLRRWLALAVLVVGAFQGGRVHAAGEWKAAQREGGALLQKGETEKAATAYARAAALLEKEQGPESPALAEALEVHAYSLHMLKRYDEKTPILERVLRIRVKRLGPDHVLVVLAQYNLAENVMLQGKDRDRGAELLVNTVTKYTARADRDPTVVQGMVQFAENTAAAGPQDNAAALLRTLVAEVVTAAGGPSDVVLPRQLAAAQALQGVGNLVAAERWWSAAVATAGAGVDVGTLNACAEVRRQLGRYEDAWPLYQRALDRLDRANPAQATAVGTLLHNQGLTRLQQGRFDEAEKLLNASMDVQRPVVGPEGLEMSYPLNDLGEVRRHQGRFDEALGFFEQALAIRERHAGKGALWGTVRQNMALVHHERGDLPTALSQLTEAITAYRSNLPPTDLRLLTALLNQGALVRDLGLPLDALGQLDALAGVVAQTLGNPHPLLATAYEQLALTERALLRPRAALEAFRAAHAVREKVLAAGHPDRARSLLNLAVAAHEAGEGAEADALLERAERDAKAAVAADHPLVAAVAHARGLRALAKRDARGAEAFFREARDIRKARLGPGNPLTTDSLEGLALARLLQGAREEARTLLTELVEVRESHRQNTLVARSDYDLINVSTELAWEATRLCNMEQAHLKDDPAAARLVLTELLRTRARGLDAYVTTRDAVLARGGKREQAALRRETELRAALVAAESAGDNARSAEVVTELTAVQRGLSRWGAEVQGHGAVVTVDAVAAALPRGSVLVEFHQGFDVDETGAGKGEAFYVAYVLDSSGAVRSRRLGDVAAVDAAVTALREAAMSPQGAVDAPARTLHALVWKPLVDVLPRLGSASTVFVAPVGALLAAPLGLMTDAAGARVTDGWEVVHLSTGRDLLRKTEKRSDGEPALLLANPDYGPAVAAPASGTDATATSRGVRALRDISFAPLPATALEAKGVRKALGRATLLSGSRATREALLKARAPRVLHLATHGFYLSSAEDNAVAAGPTRGLRLRQVPPPDAALPPPEGATMVVSPMMSSGVALAGANRLDARGHTGVMTAAEVATLDLRGTQLVVLSACQTGLGEQVGGEGVLGLRRALVQAGSQTQVLSLWNVDDDATAELMKGYYAGLAAGQGRSAALRAAQKKMQKAKKGRWAHPYYWAAFVVSGDWRPLSKARR